MSYGLLQHRFRNWSTGAISNASGGSRDIPGRRGVMTARRRGRCLLALPTRARFVPLRATVLFAAVAVAAVVLAHCKRGSKG